METQSNKSIQASKQIMRKEQLDDLVVEILADALRKFRKENKRKKYLV